MHSKSNHIFLCTTVKYHWKKLRFRELLRYYYTNTMFGVYLKLNLSQMAQIDLR